ncbi:hypothetical protein GAU_1351 [Gemmatimonas aurantiaca T-27]|uniref:Carboxypeptidase regulatory-like domain-containing protein n=2 Tax=Gemmatimonas aurantiaca TaxID=173480 RepID=C1A833_GEMAT|nr:hypothetical protein GAU_1351 [Gemmatimonas aurantiaca T-27]
MTLSTLDLRSAQLRMLLVMAFASLVPRLAATQSVSGTVVTESDSSPVSGAVVLLVARESQRVLASSRSSQSGVFRLPVSASGLFVIRVLRIGNRPYDSEPVELSLVAQRVMRIVVPSQPVQLARFDVRESARCRQNPDTATLAGQLLVEARTAFLSSVARGADGEQRALYRFFRYDRDRRGASVGDTASDVRTRQTSRPFASLSPDSIDRVGYVIADGDSVVYRGPDADILLSEGFARGHCFHVVEGNGVRAGLLGVGFRPIDMPSGIVGIRGTIWMVPESRELRDVEFSYQPISRDESQAGVGGEVRFLRLPDGSWLVRSWELRMPRVQMRRIAPVLTGRPMPGRTIREVVGTQVFGGAVIRLEGAGIMFADTTELERAAAERAARATERVFTLRHDVCGPIAGGGIDLSIKSVGVAEGRLRDSSGTSLVDVLIRADWQSDFRVGIDERVRFQNRGRETRTVEDGRFVLCELPFDVPISIRALVADRAVAQQTIRLNTAKPVDTLALTGTTNRVVAGGVTAAETQSATLRLRVLGELGEPLADAEVTIVASGTPSEAAVRHRTNTDGHATFDGLKAGAVEIAVRRIGQAMQTLRLDIGEGRNEATIRMSRTAVSLDPVRTIGNRVVNARYAEVDRRIRAGVANAVVGRVDFERVRPITVTQMLRRVQGIRLEDSSGTTIITSGRGDRITPGGSRLPCILRVMVDGVLSTASQVERLVPTDIHAIEVFLGPARIPLELGARSSGWCGLLAVWTRVD